MKRIAWFFNDWSINAYRQENNLYGGIGYYRVIKPAEVLSKWYDIDVIGAEFRKWGVGGDTTGATAYQRLEQYDLIISKHAHNAQMASNLLATADYYKKKIIVDADDNYLAVRKNNPASKDYDIGEQGRYNLSAFLSLASGITVSTAPLKRVFKTLNKKIDVLPNCNDLNDWPNVRKQWDDGIVRIGYAGAQGHLDDIELIIEPMAYLLAKYPNVMFEVIGLWPVEAMNMVNKMNEYCKKDISKQVKLGGGTMAWQGYPEMLASFGWDIGIAPLIEDTFNEGKSHIKWMEYSSVFVATIASPVYPYKEDIFGVKTIQDGVTGFLASNSEEWYAKLEKLVLDKDLRYSIATNAHEYVKNNWQYSQWADRFKKVIDKYI